MISTTLVIAEKSDATTWADQVQGWGPIAAVVVAIFGILAIYSTVRETRKQQRTQAGPYVRVDLGVAGSSDGNFNPPTVHYTNTSDVVDLDESTPNHEKVIISAWLRNYQTHSLGFALGVTLKIFAEAYSPEKGHRRSDVEVQVAYLEHGKPIRVDLIKAKRPTSQEENIIVYVEQLSYFDFYDQLNFHMFGEKGTNALHGRLSCVISRGEVVNLPESWRRGRQVTYDE